MMILTHRCLKIFFRNRSAVFFSLLSSIIIIGLYILFLGDTYTSNLDGISQGRQMMDQWVMAGLLATSSVSTTMGALSIMVEDRDKKIRQDFDCSPVKKTHLLGAYLCSAYIIGTILSFITLIFSQVYVLCQGGIFLDFLSWMKVCLILSLTNLTNTSMMFFLTSFFKSNHTFSTASTLTGTLIGFLTGIYLPIGMLPSAIQWIIKLFPTSHGAVLLRQIMMAPSIQQGFHGIPMTYLEEFQHTLGITFQMGKQDLSAWMSILYLVVTSCLFFAIALFNYDRYEKTPS